jgi:DNA helicase-2/ATP-dependent DNA helicase PcrA
MILIKRATYAIINTININKRVEYKMNLDLNVSQKQAVTCPVSPTIVIAGPGSGKTHVIINRIHYMIKTLNCLPSHILVVTFSKLAAREMNERFNKQYADEKVNFGTLHSIFYRILRQSDPIKYHLQNLINENEKKIILQNLFMKLQVDEYEDFIDEFLKHLALMKNQLINPKHYYPDGLSKEVFLKLFHEYEYYKEINQKFDFDDMLVDCYYLLDSDKILLNKVRQQYRYVLVDEFQDINLVQFEIIKMITETTQNIFVVGDDDQSIYKFRGAKPEFLLQFKNHFKDANQFFLDVNYRSTEHILNYSTAVIAYNKNRYLKKLTTPNEQGTLPEIIHCKDVKDEAISILNQIIALKNSGQKWSDMAIIYRTNLEARPIVEMLLSAHIAFTLRDGMISLYDQWITKDILGYLTLAQNPNNTELALKIINKPKRYISKAVIEATSRLEGTFLFNLLSSGDLTEWQKNYIQQLLFDLQTIKEKPLNEAIAYIRKNIGYENYILDYCSYRKMPHTTLFEVLDEIEDSSSEFKSVTDWEAFLIDVSQRAKEETNGSKAVKDAVTLTTIHGAKGLEFENVFIINLIEGNIPYHKSNNEIEIEEERRLLYVAMTRAKKQLYLYIPAEKYAKPAQCSSFIEQLLSQYLLDRLQKNKVIIHKKFGRGEVIKIMDNYLIEVQFGSQMIRKIDGNYCLNNGIIYWEE